MAKGKVQAQIPQTLSAPVLINWVVLMNSLSLLKGLLQSGELASRSFIKLGEILIINKSQAFF